MSDKYYRGLRNSIDDTKYKLQFAGMTLKINENKNIINGIKNDISGLNAFSDEIGTNKTDVASNLTKINTNKTDITSNLGKLNNIKNDMIIKIKKDIYKKIFIISTMSTNSNSKKLLIYILIQIFQQMVLLKLMQIIIIFMMIVIILVIYINFIMTIKNLKKLN